MRRILPFPTAEDVAAKYQLLTTEELEKLVLVLVDTEPPDTGAPKGQPRYYHCRGKTKKCDLCRQWIRWQTEFDLLGLELARRRRLQWGGVMNIFIVKWHVIDTSKRQTRVDSGVLQVTAADKLDAIDLTRQSLAIVNWKHIEFYIDEVVEIA